MGLDCSNILGPVFGLLVSILTHIKTNECVTGIEENIQQNLEKLLIYDIIMYEGIFFLKIMKTCFLDLKSYITLNFDVLSSGFLKTSPFLE